jgi:hypothetical protein
VRTLFAKITIKHRIFDRRAVLAIVLVFHVFLLLHGIGGQFLVVDETAHVPAGLFHWKTGEFGLYRVNPPLPRMIAVVPLLFDRPRFDFHRVQASPGTRVDFEVGRDFAKFHGDRYLGLVRKARYAGIGWSVVGGLLIFRWSKELYGSAAGLVSSALWFFDPTVLAFSQHVVPDVPAAVAGIGASYLFRQYLLNPRLDKACLAGLGLGIALLTKFTFVVFFIVWPMIAIVHLAAIESATDDDLRILSKRILTRIGETILLFITTIYIINLGYFFADSFRPLGNFSFQSRLLSGRPAGVSFRHSPVENRFRGTRLENVRIPLPAEFLQGIDAQRVDFENGFPSYLDGQWRNRGWYRYYVHALLVKEPIGTIALVVASVFLAFFRRGASARFVEEATLLIPAIVILAFVSSQIGFNHHMRYILPIFPFLAISAGKLANFWQSSTRVIGAVVSCSLAWSIGSSLAIAPHWMSYFNEAAGGPERGHDHLVDSNIDWGQDLLYLKAWINRHPEARPLGLAFFHMLDPKPYLNVDFTIPPLAPDPDQSHTREQLEKLGPHPGYFAISVGYLRGITFSAPDGGGGFRWIPRHDSFAYFQSFKPIARAGYSIYIYHITLDEANEARRKMGLPPLPSEDSRGSVENPPERTARAP